MIGYAGVGDHASVFNNVDPTLSNKMTLKTIASAERVYKVMPNTLWVVACSIQKTAGAAATAGHVRHRCVRLFGFLSLLYRLSTRVKARERVTYSTSATEYASEASGDNWGAREGGGLQRGKGREEEKGRWMQ